ncbi:MAG: hypothetical protein ABFD08_13010 [Syntrophomonas sp.]
MTEKRNVILKRIVEFYLDSPEFNGIPHWQLHAEVGGTISDINQQLEKLLDEGEIVLNTLGYPNIKKYDIAPGEEQVQALRNWQNERICVFPSEKLLQEIIDQDYLDQPFTRMVALGKPQLAPRYFSIAVLEQYLNDPRYMVEHTDFWGSIIEAAAFEEFEPYLLPNFGIGYRDNGERIIFVSLRYLCKMPAEDQVYWKGFMLPCDMKIASKQSDSLRRAAF